MSNQTTNKLIKEIESLPVDERIRIADSVLKTLNKIDQDIEDQWIAEAETRLSEMKSGKVSPIPGDKVFERIQKRFSK